MEQKNKVKKSKKEKVNKVQKCEIWKKMLKRFRPGSRPVNSVGNFLAGIQNVINFCTFFTYFLRNYNVR